MLKTRFETACVIQVRNNSSLKVVRECGHRLGQDGGVAGNFKIMDNNIQGQTDKLDWHKLYYCVVIRQWSN